MSAEPEIIRNVELEQRSLTISQEAKAIVIKDQATYDSAAEKLLAARELIKKIDETFDPDIDRWNKGHKAAIATKKKVLGDLPEVNKILGKLISNWEYDQEQKRLEAQRKADEEARKREEEVRFKLAEEAAKQGATEETQMEILETPMPVQRTIVQPMHQRVAGIGTRTNWKWRIVDISKIPDEYWKLDDIKISGIVRATKQTTNIPGIEVYSETGVSVRR